MTRLNVFIAQHTTLSRRTADKAIERGKVTINNQPALLGQTVEPTDKVVLDGQIIDSDAYITTVLLNKPVGFVCSRNGQGSKTVYSLLPKNLQHLQTIGRLDKDSSGLLLLTNDGKLAHELTHPSRQKMKVYEIKLDQPLAPLHQQMISDHGIQLSDGQSRLVLDKLSEEAFAWQVTMHEGRNRQIRRTFASLGYQVIKLHRTKFGSYTLAHNDKAGQLEKGEYMVVNWT